ncbi:MAG: HIT family protein [Cyanobacteria bacterium P01_D01_bin.128]
MLRGEAPATFVYRDDWVSAFMDIQPVNPGHVLVVPNQSVASLSELDEETGAQIFRVAQRIAKALQQSELRCEGVNLFLADGAAAMQEVFHVHLHVFPRYRGDGFGLQFSERYFTKPSRSELENAGAKIRQALDAAAA